MLPDVRERLGYWSWNRRIHCVCMLTHSTVSLNDFVYSRLFAKSGYSVALLARGADSVNALAKEITESGAEVLDFSFQFIPTLTVVGRAVPSAELFA